MKHYVEPHGTNDSLTSQTFAITIFHDKTIWRSFYIRPTVAVVLGQQTSLLSSTAGKSVTAVASTLCFTTRFIYVFYRRWFVHVFCLANPGKTRYCVLTQRPVSERSEWLFHNCSLWFVSAWTKETESCKWRANSFMNLVAKLLSKSNNGTPSFIWWMWIRMLS